MKSIFLMMIFLVSNTVLGVTFPVADGIYSGKGVLGQTDSGLTLQYTVDTEFDSVNKIINVSYHYPDGTSKSLNFSLVDGLEYEEDFNIMHNGLEVGEGSCDDEECDINFSFDGYDVKMQYVVVGKVMFVLGRNFASNTYFTEMTSVGTSSI